VYNVQTLEDNLVCVGKNSGEDDGFIVVDPNVQFAHSHTGQYYSLIHLNYLKLAIFSFLCEIQLIHIL